MKNDKKNKPERFEITELFMARAGKKDWTRCFHGTISREKDEHGREVAVSGKIMVNEGYVWSRAEDQDKLGEKLDELVTMVIDHHIHSLTGMNDDIAKTRFNLN